MFGVSGVSSGRGWLSAPTAGPDSRLCSCPCGVGKFPIVCNDGPREPAISSGEYERDILAHLLVISINGVDGRCGQFPLADLHLLVEMRKFSACVLREESAVEGEGFGKEIRK